jgi:hypothetical protein
VFTLRKPVATRFPQGVLAELDGVIAKSDIWRAAGENDTSRYEGTAEKKHEK